MSDVDTAGPIPRPNDVAVIGMCGRFPGAPDLDRFWSRLRAGDDLLTSYTDAELTEAGVPRRLLDDPRYVGRAAVLPDAFHFDHEFFGVTRREAKLLDPQQRILLEVAWELLETIGYAGGAGDQSIGVFAGASVNTYLTNVVACACDPLTHAGTELMLTNDKDYLTTRISYKLGLKGPSVNVQTACSTSLVAVHMGVQSLLTGDCDIVLAGGVSVIANEHPGYVFSEGMMFSPDGRCRPFDADAAGTTFGDGVGLVALKRLAEAIEDGDRILAVVKGSAINNDGSDKIGYSAPSVEGQRAVIAEAQAVAEVDSDTIGYVEAHGTATALGDPIEFTALSEAFADGGSGRAGHCALGSVKANVGHLAAAAGITGFIKTVLALQHREIPGHPAFTRPNPAIDLADSPFHINTRPVAWPSGDTPRRAGVSSFGIGGTNAHVVLEEAPPLPERETGSEGTRLLALSAKSDAAVRELAGRLADTLEGADAPELADVAHTLRAGRRDFEHRYAVAADDRATAAAGFRALAEGRAAGRAVRPSAPSVSFLFGEVPAEEFRSLVGELAAVATRAQQSVDSAVICAENPLAGRVTAAQVLATLWTESGVRAEAVGGAGAGEILAACFAGALDPADALALLSWRSETPTTPPPTITPRPARIPLLSAVVGGELPPERVLDPAHWTRDVWEGDRLNEAFAGRAEDDALILAIGTPPEGTAEALGLYGGWTDGVESVPQLPPVSRLFADAARLWVAGVPVDWSEWAGGEPRRVPLPTHPLNREHLRLEPPRTADTGAEPVLTPSPSEWLHTPSWRRLGPLVGAPATGGGLPAGPWLLFADAGGTGDALAGALRERGATPVLVRRGGGFVRVAADSYTVDPADPGDHARLFAALAEDGVRPERVVHLWSLDIAPDVDAGDGLDGACDLGLFSVLDTATQLARHQRGEAATHLTVVTRDVHDITGAEAIAPAAAMADAALTVVPQEFPGLYCRGIDIGTDTVTVDAFLAEVVAPDAAPVAFRYGQRWRRHFVPVPADSHDMSADSGPTAATGRLRPGGVYLITGGLGRTGLALAEQLARVTGARLVLTRRTPLPPPHEFDRWTAEHGPADPVSRKIEAVRSLERLGATVMAASADVTDARAMRELVGAARHRFGRVDGWFHCAGVPLDRATGRIDGTDRAVWRDILAPRVRGALALAEVFADAPADFGVLMSSLAPVLGGVGAAGVAAADRFLDASSSGEDGLISVGRPADRLSPEREAEVLDLVLRSDAPSRLVVSPTDLERRLQQRQARPAPVVTAPAPPSGDDLKRTLAKLWSEVLRTEVDRYDLSLFDIDDDSLLAVRLARRIGTELDVPLRTIDLLRNPTIDQLAAHIDRHRDR